ncbi:ubiquitin carboxyl-terminal hydrolase [Anaeramoeba flamelloides]|uniref:Ubiquitin carboxyl-terminal hydrolase n=1 Tax=Anaeramoeba flamelloides TaxID=1746091 RepID=A0AAV7Z911_9EUKA|nr:ubiquitin carboxyl-terminal hydrolase [Anaeramoeba flamelloides]
MEFVGIKNQGVTDYINSVLQQLFIVIDFRESVLNVSFNKGKEELNENELILYELKNIFHILSEKQVDCTETVEFCKAFIDYGGNPINVLIQMDTLEFLNLLFYRLELALSGLVTNSFGGTLSSQVVCREANHLHEIKEPFFSISLEVSGITSIKQSLKQFCESEILESENQYYCDKCGKKVDALKRLIISKMPKHLIFHLNRYQFDLNTFERIKLNSFFEFPIKINLKEFLLQNENQNQNEDQNYTLSGIIVHTGTLNSGHYHSITNTKTKWLSFNDRVVSEYNTADLENDFYGGLDHDKKKKKQSAYMLIYRHD